MRRRKPGKSTISVHEKPVILVRKSYTRLSDSKKKVVYFIRGNKGYPYEYGRSRILYIGRTEKAKARPFDSLKRRARNLLDIHGMRDLEIAYIEATPKQKVNITTKLENACLWIFRSEFGELPKENEKGKHLKLSDEEHYVSFDRIRAIIRKLSTPSLV